MTVDGLGAKFIEMIHSAGGSLCGSLSNFELGLHLSSDTHADDVWDPFKRLDPAGPLAVRWLNSVVDQDA